MKMSKWKLDTKNAKFPLFNRFKTTVETKVNSVVKYLCSTENINLVCFKNKTGEAIDRDNKVS